MRADEYLYVVWRCCVSAECVEDGSPLLGPYGTEEPPYRLLGSLRPVLRGYQDGEGRVFGRQLLEVRRQAKGTHQVHQIPNRGMGIDTAFSPLDEFPACSTVGNLIGSGDAVPQPLDYLLQMLIGLVFIDLSRPF